MPEVISSVEAVFNTPEFDDAYRSRLEALYQLHINREKLGDALTSFYQSPDRSEHEVDYQVSGALEYDASRLADLYGQDTEIAIYGKLVDDALDRLAELEGQLQAVGKEQGLSEFAILGLWRHTRNEDIPQRSMLQAEIETTEEELLRLDSYIRSNSGEPLTYLNRLGVYGVILAEGGISVTGHNQVLKVPVADGSTVYAMSFQGADAELYKQTKLHIEAGDILAYEPTYYENWLPILRFPEGRLLDRTVFAVGEVAEGPLHLTRDYQLDNADFYQMAFERIRRVGRLASGANTEL